MNMLSKYKRGYAISYSVVHVFLSSKHHSFRLYFRNTGKLDIPPSPAHAFIVKIRQCCSSGQSLWITTTVMMTTTTKEAIEDDDCSHNGDDGDEDELGWTLKYIYLFVHFISTGSNFREYYLHVGPYLLCTVHRRLFHKQFSIPL